MHFETTTFNLHKIKVFAKRNNSSASQISFFISPRRNVGGDQEGFFVVAKFTLPLSISSRKVQTLHI
jgi:hypothetical protein